MTMHRLILSGCDTCAAGASWTSTTDNAPWAARYSHTSVIDAAGDIYVLGGYGTTYYSDVWMSADKGEMPHAAARPCEDGA